MHLLDLNDGKHLNHSARAVSSTNPTSVDTFVYGSWAPQTISPACAIIIGVFGFPALLVLIGRVWVRAVLQRRNDGIDDYLMIAAMPFVIAQLIFTGFATTAYGYLLPAAELSTSDQVAQAKLVFIVEVLYIFATSLIKISVLCFYERFSRREITVKFVYAVWAMICFVILYLVVAIVVLFLSCRPFSAIWNQADLDWTLTHTFNCGTHGDKVLLGSIISVTQDFITTILPFTILWRLTISMRQRVAMVGMLSGGFVVTAVGVWRVWCTFKVENNNQPSYYGFQSYIAATYEVTLAVIFSSIPALRVFFKRERGQQPSFHIVRRIGAQDIELGHDRSTGMFGPLSIGFEPGRLDSNASFSQSKDSAIGEGVVVVKDHSNIESIHLHDDILNSPGEHCIVEKSIISERDYPVLS